GRGGDGQGSAAVNLALYNLEGRGRRAVVDADDHAVIVVCPDARRVLGLFARAGQVGDVEVFESVAERVHHLIQEAADLAESARLAQAVVVGVRDVLHRLFERAKS